MPALHILAEARSHDVSFRKVIIRAWQQAFGQAAAAARNRRGLTGQVRFGSGPIYEAFALDAHAPVVQVAWQRRSAAASLRVALATTAAWTRTGSWRAAFLP
jgi:hypothetical protein